MIGETVDIGIIGSGAASTTALTQLLEKVLHQNDPLKKLHILVVDKHNEFWKGIPYGNRSSVNSLTITVISDFIPSGNEQTLFFSWFTLNSENLLAHYASMGGENAATWIAENQLKIAKQEWDKIYLPRYIWGIYMRERLLSLKEKAEMAELVQITSIHGEAIQIEQHPEHYSVLLEVADHSHQTISVKKLVVAIGSPPVRNIVPAPDETYIYINDVYEPSISHTTDLLTHAAGTKRINILVVGSNASSIELVYLLNNLPQLKSSVNKIVIVSRAGNLPYHINDTHLENYSCSNLDQVKQAGDYNLETLVEAAKRDLRTTVQLGKISTHHVDRVISYALELMQSLGDDAKKIFFAKHGMQFTRLIRRSGPEYKRSADELLQAHQIELLTGEFNSVVPYPEGGKLSYINTETGKPELYDLPFQFVINCTGSDDLEQSDSRLIRNMIEKDICQVNLSGKGFVVNDQFEAAKNLYIIGPLLGGNMNDRIHFWHIENVARLLYLAPYLADCLLA
ncbi:FAD/NAD(P)-binding protein [Pedobacter sp. L105]|uniref:FAD/NAD(P)-binding protein n=1 Tax=Pedobacter sp. L105 TaxID=1641871 RepID=UPI00131B6D17|nr:FAD/NAD(P)-binding protein [Pedobacter sp. L105]